MVKFSIKITSFPILWEQGSKFQYVNPENYVRVLSTVLPVLPPTLYCLLLTNVYLTNMDDLLAKLRKNIVTLHINALGDDGDTALSSQLQDDGTIGIILSDLCELCPAIISDGADGLSQWKSALMDRQGGLGRATQALSALRRQMKRDPTPEKTSSCIVVMPLPSQDARPPLTDEHNDQDNSAGVAAVVPVEPVDPAVVPTTESMHQVPPQSAAEIMQQSPPVPPPDSAVFPF